MRADRSVRGLVAIVAAACLLAPAACDAPERPRGPEATDAPAGTMPDRSPARGTVPAATTIDDLTFTPVPNPNGVGAVRVFAVGDDFVAVTDGERDGPPAWWVRDLGTAWRPVRVAEALVGGVVDSMTSVGGRVVVVGQVPEDAAEPAGRRRTTVVSGPTIDDLRVDPVASARGDLHAGAPVDPTVLGVPAGGRGIDVRASVESFAFGPAGVVAFGTVYAGLDLDLLPPAVVAASRSQPGRIDVVAGRVVVRPGLRTIYDASLHDLGLSDEEIRFLEQPDDARQASAMWTARPGEPLALAPREAHAVIDEHPHAGQVVQAVADGYVVARFADARRVLRWWSADGRSWTPIAEVASDAEPEAITVELGGRWVRAGFTGTNLDGSAATVSQISDDHGRSWRGVPLTSGRLLGFGGAADVGVLAFGHPIDPSGNPTYPGTLFYAPDGAQWTSRPLPDLVGLDSLSIQIAAGPHAAMLVTRRAVADPPSATELFLVTRGPSAAG